VGLYPFPETFTYYEFQAPNGEKAYSACVLLRESHVSIHTYPELKYARLELSSCKMIQLEQLIDFLFKHCEAEHIIEVKQWVME